LERLFKCSYTGRIFDNELDCLKYEYEQGGKKEKYLKLIVQFLDYLKSQGVQIVKVNTMRELRKTAEVSLKINL
jgi:hypothetical protein